MNQYTGVTGLTPSYDGDGHLTGDGTSTWGYDPEGRLTSWTVGAASASYTHDGLGRRVRTTAGGQVTQALWDGEALVAEYDGAGVLSRRYVYGSDYTDVLQVQVSAGGTTTGYRVHTDALGSVVALTTPDETVHAQYRYGPYGESTTGPDALMPLRYTGQYLDAVGGESLYALRARHYSVRLGRFLQPDPIGVAGGLNLYAYVGNDPLNLTDPSGLAPVGGGVAHSLLGAASFAPGLLGSGASAVDAALYAVQGDGRNAALAGAGAVIGTVGSAGAGRLALRGIVEGVDAARGVPGIKLGSAGGATAGQRFPESVRDAAKAENPTATCVFCKRPGTGTQVDHAIPRARDGNATLDNAQLACPHCNASKGAGDFPKTPPPGYVGPWPP